MPSSFEDMSPTIELPFQRFWEIMRRSVYNFKIVQLLDFHIATFQIPPRKVPEIFLAWLPVYCNGGSKKVVKVKI